MMPTPVTEAAIFDQLRDRDRLACELGELCGVMPGVNVRGCGQLDCIYFDQESERCGLLLWDVPARLGPGALRWLVAQKPVRPQDSLDDTLATRCTCL